MASGLGSCSGRARPAVKPDASRIARPCSTPQSGEPGVLNGEMSEWLKAACDTVLTQAPRLHGQRAESAVGRRHHRVPDREHGKLLPESAKQLLREGDARLGDGVRVFEALSRPDDHASSRCADVAEERAQVLDRLQRNVARKRCRLKPLET